MEEYGLALLLPSGTNSPWKEKLFKIMYMCTHAKKKNSKIIQDNLRSKTPLAHGC